MHAERLGKYELIQHLASGGMAAVYLARITGPGGFERHVVLKTLKDDDQTDPAMVPMFLDEARLIATLHHQHIAQVFEIGREDGTYFLAMEYVHGETLRRVLETAVAHERTLPLAFGITVVCAAAAGLHHAHERRGATGTPLGIVHRDVTPSNVIVSYDGSIKLIDFGIAKADARATHTETGFIKGKVGYMAPEQVRGYAVDRRSDVFALGVLAYELLTQRRAFTGSSQFEALERAVHSDLIPPSQVVPGFPLALEDVILTALEADPDDRFPDADAMRRALEQVAASLQLPLGQAAVVGVLDKLFGFRPEPWLAQGPVDTLEEIPAEVSERTPVVMMPALGSAYSFARGSGGSPAIDDDDDDFIETDPVTLVEPERAPIALPPIPAWAPPPQLVLQARAPTAHLPRRRPKRPSRAIAIAVIGALAFGIGVTAAILVGRDDSTATTAPQAPASAAPAVRPTAPKQAPKPSPPPPRAMAPVVETVTPAATEVTLEVITEPPGATVVLDGIRLGTAPLTTKVPLKAGAWLKVRRSDRLPVKKRVRLDRDVSWTVRLPPRNR